MKDNYTSLRLDHRIIASTIEPYSKVLDLGCGNGELLEYLITHKHIDGYGIEIDEQSIYSCVEKGLSVSHEDIDSGLKDYPENFFDYVIFNQTMQQVHNPESAIMRALKIGKKVVIGFPNFCHALARIQIGILGRVPITKSLPYSWYETPNLHFLSIRDFSLFCAKKHIHINRRFYLGKRSRVYLFPNLFAYNAIFVLSINTNS